MKKVTMLDIAKMAGVSKATVSMVLSKSDNSISEETKNKVLAIAKELNYIPNSLARSLSTKKTGTEINSRIVADYANEIRNFKKLHIPEKALDLDVANWEKINSLRLYLLKDTYSTKSLFTRISDATEDGNYTEVSNLQIELDDRIKELRQLYSSYKKNLIDIE